MKNPYKHLIYTVAAGLAFGTVSPIQAADPKPGWVSLFNGKNLDNWTIRGEGGLGTFHLEGQEIVGTTAPRGKNTFLCTNRDYADFELILELKCEVRLNAGIQIRSHVHEKDVPWPTDPKRIHRKGEVYGYQCEVITQDRCRAGNFYDEGRRMTWLDELKDRPGACAAFKDGEWNEYRIVAQGDRIRSWVNGVACADFRDSADATGFIGLQVHFLPIGVGPCTVRWKNIKIRELKAGEPAN